MHACVCLSSHQLSYAAFAQTNINRNTIIFTGGHADELTTKKSSHLAESHIYNFQKGDIERVANMRNNRAGHGMAYLGGMVYVFGGMGVRLFFGTKYPASHEIYNVSSKKW